MHGLLVLHHGLQLQTHHCRDWAECLWNGQSVLFGNTFGIVAVVSINVIHIRTCTQSTEATGVNAFAGFQNTSEGLALVALGRNSKTC